MAIPALFLLCYTLICPCFQARKKRGLKDEATTLDFQRGALANSNKAHENFSFFKTREENEKKDNEGSELNSSLDGENLPLEKRRNGASTSCRKCFGREEEGRESESNGLREFEQMSLT